jgi:hypothetical protein
VVIVFISCRNLWEEKTAGGFRGFVKTCVEIIILSDVATLSQLA